MIASERNLAPPHQHRPKQHRQPPTTTKNGIKRPVRPVKLYVIDPRKLKEQLEACAAKKERESQTDEENVQVKRNVLETKPTPPESVQKRIAPSVTVSTSISAADTSNPSQLPNVSVTNILPSIVPNFTTSITSIPTPTTTPATVTVSQNGATVVGNGVTLQCISATGFVPALPLVVTNGIALLQQPIVQSSIPTGGIFLPGVTAIPGVFNSAGATIIGSPSATIKPKPKPKPKKKKKGKRKKLFKRKLDKDEDDSELTYLLKETTTRNGRVSRPVTQPQSPAAVASTIPAKNSLCPIATTTDSSDQDPDRKRPKFLCDLCHEEFISLDNLNCHLSESHKNLPKTVSLEETTKSQLNSRPSTNDLDEVIVPITNSGLEQNTVPSTTFSSPMISTSLERANCTAGPPSFNGFQLSLSSSSSFDAGVLPSISSADLLKCVPSSSYSSTNSNSTATNLPPLIPSTHASTSTATAAAYFNCGEGLPPRANSVSCVYSAPSTLSSNARTNLSVVPNVEDPAGLFLSGTPQMSTGVDVVPSSYSIPSSPLSQCQSPGLPENTDNIDHACQSPVDPMLLRSRSPFLPPLHAEISLPSVSVSNLTIPEESLTKGELFMDLGDGILENSSLLSRFCSDPAGTLFPKSGVTPTDNNEISSEAEAAAVAESDVEQDGNDHPIATSPSPHVSAPVLLETTEDANDGEIFQTANYGRNIFVQPAAVLSAESLALSSPPSATPGPSTFDRQNENGVAVTVGNGQQQLLDFPKTPQSSMVESDLSMDGAEAGDQNQNDPKKRSIWQFVKHQIKFCGISQACGEISEVAEKLSRIARDQFIPIREDEIERLGSCAPIIHVDTPFFSHLLDLPFGTYIFKEDIGRRKKLAPPPPPPMTSSELSFTCGVEDVEKFLPPDIDLISLPHLTNLDLN